MGCQYCGKEIGPLRILRDNEFCSSVHRKRYQDRLNKALGQADATGLCATLPADFITEIALSLGAPQSSASLVPIAWKFEKVERDIPMALSIPPVTTKRFYFLPVEARSAPPTGRFVPDCLGAVRLPKEAPLNIVAEAAPLKVVAEPAAAVETPPPSGFRGLELVGADVSRGPQADHGLRVVASSRLPGPLEFFGPALALAPENGLRPILLPDLRDAAAPERACVQPLAAGKVTVIRGPRHEIGIEIETDAPLELTARAGEFAGIAVHEAAAREAHAVAALAPAASAIAPRLPFAGVMEYAAVSAQPAPANKIIPLDLPDARTQAALAKSVSEPAAAHSSIAFAARLPEPATDYAAACTVMAGAPAHVNEIIPLCLPDALMPAAQAAVMCAPAAHSSAAFAMRLPGPLADAAALATPAHGNKPIALQMPDAQAQAVTDKNATALAPPHFSAAVTTRLPEAAMEYAAPSAQAAHLQELAALHLPDALAPAPPEKSFNQPVAPPRQIAIAARLPEPVAEYVSASAAIAAAPEQQNDLMPLGLPDAWGTAALAKIFTVPAETRSRSDAARMPQELPFEADEGEGHDLEFGIDPPPEANFVPLEYFCQQSPANMVSPLEWNWRMSVCVVPALPLNPIGGKLEDLLPKKEKVAFFPNAPQALQRKWNGRIVELAAAAAILAMVLGMGFRLANRVGAADAKRDVATVVPAASATRVSRVSMNSSGPFARVRQAIAGRAAVEVSDTFRTDMEAWGHAKSWAPGWTRSADGYVVPGKLALFQPSMDFKDYNMEFFGQIESKSMGWVVRAHDPKNYYAMKFTVIETGLRPIIAVVHYPVIDGKPGKRSETPLNVMVHNNTAYHIEVAVNGTHVVTSIEGQEVDRWMDDEVPAGGVGFFSEAGERARLYWMKVSKNQDFLGKVCAYVSGSSPEPRAIAMFANHGIYHGNQFFTATPHGN